jgi:hypothetical protein
MGLRYPQPRTTLAHAPVIVNLLVHIYISPSLIAVPLLLNDSPLNVLLHHGGRQNCITVGLAVALR